MMNRLLCLLAVLSIASAHCPYHKHRHTNSGHTRDYHNRLFEEISNDVIALDKKVQNLCTRNTNGATKEIIESETFKLSTPLDGFDETEIEVKIRNRILYISANKPPLKSYNEIRVLPSFVDTKQASYQLEEGKLIVSFNIKTAATNECTTDVDSNVITVPRFQPFIFDERIGRSDAKR
ncbi:unnamed protein product [Chilo suppressalis]|uniref:SHSP domain-containing protein n=1 Tax=Chilo suppressalis TaxID=168631 RepID=A0ABN8B874_CHISP|nr:unnamed protein product [Chilo suppressalis]